MANEETDETDDSPDVAPPIVIQTLTLLWIVLFGGRWIAVSLLQWNGFLSPEQVAAFDSGVLSRLYLILLALTILIVALRVTRRYSAPSSGSPQQGSRSASTAVPDSRQEPRNP